MITTMFKSGRNIVGGALSRASEILGVQRTIRSILMFASQLSARVDAGVGDYEFWDKARYGKISGLELSGLLLKPLFSKVAAWVMGKPPKFKVGDNDDATQALEAWVGDNFPKILSAYEDSVAVGDWYLVINPDLTVVAKPPDAVRPLVADNDFSNVIGWQVDETYPHPTEPGRTMRIQDQYTATKRTRTVWMDSAQMSVQTFPVFINRVPVVHIPNNRSANELFGKSEAIALPTMLHRYGEILDAAMEGNMRQGRPTPVVEKMGSPAQVDKFWEKYGKTRTKDLADGTTESEEYIEFDADRVMTLGGDATFNWKSPAPFTGDTGRLLELLYYLYLEHTELPEWVLGSAIASSQASANTQVEPLVKFIEKKRTQCGWLIEVCEIVLAFMSVYDVKVRTEDKVTIQWEDMTRKDGNLIQTTIAWALEKGLILPETALRLAPIDVENPEEEVKKAEKKADEDRDAFDERVGSTINRLEATTPDDDTEDEGESDADEDVPQQREPIASRNGRQRQVA